MRGLSKRGWVAIVVVAVLAVGVFGCAKILSSDSPSDGLSAKTSAYADKAMAKTDKALQQFDNGNVARAAATWNTIGTMPIDTVSDRVLSGDLLAYLNNARYYMIGDGSATLKDVEESRQAAGDTLASLRP